jgi:hypothetical protein
LSPGVGFPTAGQLLVEIFRLATLPVQHLLLSLTKTIANKDSFQYKIRMFLGILDPDPLVRDTDPDPDPSIIKQKY